MDILLLILVWLSGFFFALYGLLLRKNPWLITTLSKSVTKAEIIRAQKISSIITSVCSFILGFIIVYNNLHSYLVLLIPIIWGVSNSFFLQKRKNKSTLINGEF